MFLKHHLDTFLANFPKERHLASDPVQFVHRYEDPQDREVVGLIASAFAYGNVKIVLKTVGTVLDYLGPSPSQTIASFDPRKDFRRLRGFYHRFNTSRDLAGLFWIIRRTLEDYGSLESAFTSALSPADVDVTGALDRFCEILLGFGHEQFYPRGELKRRLGVRFFFPSPVAGSACKRLNLYLRWMVRRHGVDLGVWKSVDPGRLVIPLDAHVLAIARRVRLTRYRSPGWRMAVDITARLRRLDPADPVKYDFALHRMGLLKKADEIRTLV